MLNDARSLWTSASSVVQNFASALTEDLEKDTENEEDQNDMAKELEIYKRMLEEAQMSLVELSKASRIAIAEKEAELSLYKNVDSASTIDPKAIELARVMADKTVLQDTLRDMEQQVSELRQDKNKVDIKHEMYDEVKQQLSLVKAEYARVLDEAKAKDKMRGETIDDLVQEYSKLASEVEVSEQRLHEVTRENEILVTKMHVLETSISEIADRELYREGGVEPDAQQAMQLKEARSRLINLQYDLKERDAEIAALKAAAGSRIGANAGDGEQLVQLTDEVNRLTAEKSEAESVVRRHMEALEVRTRELQTLEEAVRVREEALRGQQEALTTQESEFRVKEETFGASESEVRVKESALAARESELRAAQEALRAQEETLRARDGELKVKEEALRVKEAAENSPTSPFRQTLQAEVSKAKSELSERSQECVVLRSQLAQAAEDAQTERAVLTARVAELESQLVEALASVSRGREEHAAALASAAAEWERRLGEGDAAALSGLRGELEAAAVEREGAVRSSLEAAHAAELAELRRRHEEDSAALRSEWTAREGEIRRDLAAAAEEKQSAALAALRAELETAATLRASQHTAELNSVRESHCEELQSAVATLRREMETQSGAQVEALRVELEARHTEATAALEARLREESTSSMEKQRRVDAEAHSAALLAVVAEKDAALEQAMQAAAEQLQTALDEARAAAAEAAAEAQSQFDAELENAAASRAEIERQLNDTLANLNGLIAQAAEEIRRAKDEERTAALEALQRDMQRLLDSATAEKDEYFSLYSKEREQRKLIHNKLIELQGNIRVICRARPVLEVERRAGAGNEVDVTEFHSDDVLSIQRDPQTKTRFEFDRVFSQGSSQEEVFVAVQPLCVSVLDGFNVCIFAYGQTGSGKTFTMEGCDGNRGVAPRAVTELFNNVSQLTESGNYEYSVKFSMLEIYNETIRDLLDSSNAKDKDKLDVRQTAEGVNIVQGLIEEDVDGAVRVAELMAIGQSNRAVGSHDMNEHSSRSHSILTLTCRGKNIRDGSTTFGKLHLIDLAGSERLSKTDATGDRLKEAQNINRSLSALGDVINALGNKKATHIPYRNSKLTFLLQDSLGGNSKVLMFVNISPAVYNLSETLCSLNFASRCRSVELGQAKRQTDDASVVKRKSILPESGTSGVNGGGVGALSSSTAGSTSNDKAPITPLNRTSRSSLGPGVSAAFAKKL